MAENQCQGPGKCGWVESERLLAKTFDAWRAEFRTILEDHRRDIQNRLEMIERRMEQKSDRENVDLVVRGINEARRLLAVLTEGWTTLTPTGMKRLAKLFRSALDELEENRADEDEIARMHGWKGKV